MSVKSAMARSILPPTPDLDADERAREAAYSSASTANKTQDHSGKLSSLQVTFELPPSAISNNDTSRAAAAGHSPVSPTAKVTYLQPSESVKSRRRTSTAPQQKEAFTLPPPPTRTRRIIQMKPRPQEDAEETPTPAKGSSTNNKSGSGSGGVSKPAAKKQPSQTSAAGRKMARKTAHSLIERRRRSKMNEEFAVLKGLIPACEGEMHKLAILQASIEYVRYLEDCLSKLKAQHGHDSTMTTPEFRLGQRDEEEIYDENQDVEMTDTETPSSNQPQQEVSPPTGRSRQHSYSSASTDYHRHYSFSASTDTSPAMLPQGYTYPESTSHSALTSPALRPQVELDHEASAALLMLNSDRRAVGFGSGRGMSVRDLLSS